MDVLEELEYYCKTSNPVGALMLSGEWGCGKTYLIKNRLSPALEEAEEDKCVILCISLFGLDSIDAIKQEVKKQWLEKASEIIPQDGGKILSKAADGYKKLFGAIKEVLPEKWQNGGEAVSSIIDLVYYIPISNTIGDKKVILVFDDLERSNISSADILGCINDYCENQHFNVIIVANEDKIRKAAGGDKDSNETRSVDTGLPYNEIKEKIVQRVIHFTPNYDDVVDNSIEWLADGIEYKAFLRKNKEMLVRILVGDFDDKATIAKFKKDNYRFYGNKEEYNEQEKQLRSILKQRPHNIRSFKCAIQDFERIYTMMKEVGFENCDNWLISFTCYMMTSKAGFISDTSDYISDTSVYNYYYSCDIVEKLYPNIFNLNYMMKGIAHWILKGDWNQGFIEEELRYVRSKEVAQCPVDILKTHYLTGVEDDIIEKGFSDLLKSVYTGKLTLDEYLIFIENGYYARKYKVNIPVIDWQKVQEGIEIQFEQMLALDYKNAHVHDIIDLQSKKCFNDGERSSYQLIKDFCEQNRLVHKKNQLLYIELLGNDLNQAFVQLNNKNYGAFTLEMAAVTYSAYQNAPNAHRIYFVDWFSRNWVDFRSMQGMNVDLTEQSLKKLRKDLETLRDEYEEKKKQISVWHTQRFIENIDKILDVENVESEVKHNEQQLLQNNPKTITYRIWQKPASKRLPFHLR